MRFLLRDAELIIFGGIGFSGYNNKFNAKNGIYQSTISIRQEIEETKKFENLYKIIVNFLYDKNLIVFTHMPIQDWNKDKNIYGKFIYVNGHTHINQFYDDGEIRVYSDNQIGYFTKETYTKFFYVKKGYDWYSDYEDGIYKISKEDYIKFYRGKNITINYNRTGNIYMLKKSKQ